MKYFGLSDKGLVRENNEDHYAIIRNHANDLLAIVCDGVGGSADGEVASYETCKYLSEVFAKSHAMKYEDLLEFLKYHFRVINQNIQDMAKNHGRSLGTTLTGIVVCKNYSLVFNIGDSRVYGFKDGILKQLSVDHNVLNELIRNQNKTYEEAIKHDKAYHITRAIGSFSHVEADFYLLDKSYQDILICSDGLSGVVEHISIKDILKQNISVAKKAEKLVDSALEGGGYDNITVILIEMEGINE